MASFGPSWETSEFATTTAKKLDGLLLVDIAYVAQFGGAKTLDTISNRVAQVTLKDLDKSMNTKNTFLLVYHAMSHLWNLK